MNNIDKYINGYIEYDEKIKELNMIMEPNRKRLREYKEKRKGLSASILNNMEEPILLDTCSLYRIKKKEKKQLTMKYTVHIINNIFSKFYKNCNNSNMINELKKLQMYLIETLENKLLTGNNIYYLRRIINKK